MAREVDSYWKIFAEEVPSDLGVMMTDQQVKDLAYALEGAHENHGLHSGRDIADANWKAQRERELVASGMNKVLAYIEERVADLDRGPNRMFDVMTDRQRMAMAEIVMVRKLIAKEMT